MSRHTGLLVINWDGLSRPFAWQIRSTKTKTKTKKRKKNNKKQKTKHPPPQKKNPKRTNFQIRSFQENDVLLKTAELLTVGRYQLQAYKFTQSSRNDEKKQQQQQQKKKNSDSLTSDNVRARILEQRRRKKNKNT